MELNEKFADRKTQTHAFIIMAIIHGDEMRSM